MGEQWRCLECGLLLSWGRHWCANCSVPRLKDEGEERKDRQDWSESRADYLIHKEWL
jgi:hypothetical protein